MTESSLTLRPYAGPSDAAPLADLWLEASLRAHPFLGAERLTAQRQEIADTYLPQADTWVACEGPRPLGFISLLEDFVAALFVAPHAQGRGIGSRLLEQAAENRGALNLEVYACNTPALAFYRARGFHEVARRPQDDLGLPFELVRLQRP